MKAKTKRSECNCCHMTRKVTTYEDAYYFPNHTTGRSEGRPLDLCESCANVHSVHRISLDPIGQLLLKVNSKLDMLRKKGRHG